MYYSDDDRPLSYHSRSHEMAMIDLRIVEVGDSIPFPELAHKKVIEADISRAIILQNGTSGGLPAVCLIIDLPGGEVLLLQTTGRLFNMINGALVGASQRWGVEL